MSKSRIIIVTLLTGVVIFTVCRTILAQASQVSSENLKTLPFLELVDMKVTLTSEIAELEQVLKELPSKISDAEKTGRELEVLNDRLKKLNSQKSRTPDEEREVLRLSNDINVIRDQVGSRTPEALKAELQTKQKQLDDKKATMQNVRKTLAGIYTPEQSFKLAMSITFAALIGLVIIGFFTLSYIDPTIRQAIFSGQTGIQFLTLFSLVIAIILFGITAILQDKELAALLGGLSGYILGRYNQSKEGSDAAAPAAPAPGAPDAQQAQGAAAQGQGAAGLQGAQGAGALA